MCLVTVAMEKLIKVLVLQIQHILILKSKGQPKIKFLTIELEVKHGIWS